MKKLVLLFLLLALFTKTNAQNNLPPVYEIKSDTGSNRNLDSAHWQMLEDPTGKLTIGDVSKAPLANKFHAYDSAKAINYSIHTYWLRYILKNQMTHDAKISISKYAAYVDFYTTINGKWNHQTTGIDVPWSKRAGFKRIINIPFTIKPGEELTIYERDKFDYISPRPYFSVTFSFTDKLIKDSYINNDQDYISSVFNSIQLGITIVAVLFNLMFYKVAREKEYLFFSLFLFFLGIQSINYGIPNFLFREHPALAYNVSALAAFLFFFFMIHFFRCFFKTFQYYPRWDKFLFLFSFIVVFNGIAFIYLLPFTSLSPTSFDKTTMLMASVLNLCMFFMLVTVLLFIRNRDKTLNLKAITALPIFIYWGLYDSYTQLSSIINLFYSKQLPQIAWLNKWSILIATICYTWLIVLFSWSLFQRYQKLQKDLAKEALDKERLAKEKEIERSQLIEQQKVELEKTVEERTAELKYSLQELKSTQSQLVQSEKMASLGELTAGIAHEIQNPLNFVNNFSEVNKEMIDELQTELKSGNTEEAIVISNDIKDNEEKINYHGKRADAIVKNMLQHSKQTKGIKESTDINALCDEYLRLSYHGLRAKDKNFNADFKTGFDNSIKKINIVPQDIGRVLLNLFNNALYAVNEKKKLSANSYQPVAEVKTRRINGKIEITVSDNGNGISASVMNKIFQPFFTTKPAGEGTGLGLSLSYDIIKAHSGEIKVETKEGEGSKFIIQLPLKEAM